MPRCSVSDVEWESDGVRTPQSYFDELNRKYRFVIDLFASAENQLVAKNYADFSKDYSAFDHAWPRLDVGWCYSNPPYSRGNLDRFITKAVAEAKLGSGVVALIPATPGPSWFNERILRCCDTLDAYTVDRGVISGYELSMQGIGYRQKVMFLRGRVPFAPPIGYPADKDWNPPATDSIILELRPPLR